MSLLLKTHVIGGTPEPDDIPIDLVDETTLGGWLEGQPDATRQWVRATGFEARPRNRCLVPDARHGLGSVLVGVGDRTDPWCCADLPGALPAGRYRIRTRLETAELEPIAVGWGLGAYRFDRYRKKATERERATLCIDPEAAVRANRQIEAVTLVRDLINTPAGDLLPDRLDAAASALSARFGAKCTSIVGDDLIANGYPAIHAVGRASAVPPRLIDLRWGDPADPRVTLAGKGVCFDSGGLDLKPASGMRLMKKDMGGAAHVLGLARLAMDAALPIRLRVLVPAVENAVSGNAFRPGDVLSTRAGVSVEVDNTDAEGRIVLCDALTEAASEEPDALIDFATLTGAARVALGPDLPALFSNDDALAQGLARHAKETHDPLWRMPLHGPYDDLLESRVADIANAASTPHAGAITAALFLRRFVPDSVAWAHFDLMAWNQRSRPGRPRGGEAMALRATWAWMEERYRR